MGSAQGVIFDWDGVIADSLDQIHDVYQRTCRHFDGTLPVTTVEEFRGWYKARWEQNFLEMGFSEKQLPMVLEHARSLVSYGEVRLFPEVVDFIQNLAPVYRLGIASTTDTVHIRGRLEQAGLLHLFPVVVGGEEGGSDKIKRYGDALHLMEVDASRSVAVGDTALDIRCARHWGMQTVGVTYGWNVEVLVKAATPDRLVHHPREVEPAVRALLDRAT